MGVVISMTWERFKGGHLVVMVGPNCWGWDHKTGSNRGEGGASKIGQQALARSVTESRGAEGKKGGVPPNLECRGETRNPLCAGPRVYEERGDEKGTKSNKEQNKNGEGRREKRKMNIASIRNAQGCREANTGLSVKKTGRVKKGGRKDSFGTAPGGVEIGKEGQKCTIITLNKQGVGKTIAQSKGKKKTISKKE